MNTKLLVISHIGAAHSRNPFDGSADPSSLDKAKLALAEEDVVFDLVLGTPCEAAGQIAAGLAPGVPFEEITLLKKDGGQLGKVLPFFEELGFLADFESMASHPLIHSVDTLAESIGWELEAKIKKTGARSVLVLVFPPITQLLIVYFRSDSQGCSEIFRSMVLTQKLPSCTGWLLTDDTAGQGVFGHDSYFPPRDL